MNISSDDTDPNKYDDELTDIGMEFSGEPGDKFYMVISSES